MGGVIPRSNKRGEEMRPLFTTLVASQLRYTAAVGARRSAECRDLTPPGCGSRLATWNVLCDNWGMAQEILVRFFAAAADAAGRNEETLDISMTTIAGVREELSSRYGGEMSRVLELCSFLLNGSSAEDSEELRAGADGAIRLDVLPPFAGG